MEPTTEHLLSLYAINGKELTRAQIEVAMESLSEAVAFVTSQIFENLDIDCIRQAHEEGGIALRRSVCISLAIEFEIIHYSTDWVIHNWESTLKLFLIDKLGNIDFNY